ncbi:MAG: phenylalanine--tRNA ligase subunit alpha [Candidatus Levyibacteriota bacterium]
MEENQLLQQFDALRNDATGLILSSESLSELNEIKLDFLGKNGRLTLLMKELSKVPAERRPEIGKLANEVKVAIEGIILDQERKLGKKTPAMGPGALDVTMPGELPPEGHLHLITQAIEEIAKIFEHIGFTRVRYPEVEWDWYAFGALNFPQNHPARDDWETFFIEEEADPEKGRMLLTPHTSSGQIREMTKGKTPIKMVNIAKTYRRQSDVSHTPMFHQFETLVIGEGISITHLKGVLDYFAKSWFGPGRKTRIRPYHFQFTEPSFETDVSCGVCNGQGCNLCKEGWLELGGAGMVHPNVIKNCGLDPKKYTGFASGWGVERVLMMREGLELDDLRTLYSNDLRFLEQF